MSYEKKNRKFIAKPVYEGGEKELKKFVYKHLKYPKEHLEDQIEGTVGIKIDISAKGKVTNTRILKSLGKSFDKEADRVMKLLRFNIPGAGGRSGKVIFHRTMKIKFSPPKVKKASQRIQYNITTSNKKTPTNTNKKEGGSYGYTIHLG